MTRLRGTSRLAAAMLLVLLSIAACGSMDRNMSGNDNDRVVHEPNSGGY